MEEIPQRKCLFSRCFRLTTKINHHNSQSVHQPPQHQGKLTLPPPPSISPGPTVTPQLGVGLWYPSPLQVGMLTDLILWRSDLVQATRTVANSWVQRSSHSHVHAFTSVLLNLWLFLSLCPLFWDGPWALWYGMICDIDVFYMAEHAVDTYCPHFGCCLYSKHCPLHKDIALIRSESSHGLTYYSVINRLRLAPEFSRQRMLHTLQC